MFLTIPGSCANCPTKSAVNYKLSSQINLYLTNMDSTILNFEVPLDLKLNRLPSSAIILRVLPITE